MNDDELGDLIEFGRPLARRGALHRIHGRRRRDAVVAGAGDVAAGDAGRAVRRATDRIEPIGEPASSAPAERYRLPDGTTFGIIASTTDPFCRTCDRSRLTADGMWFLCLYATDGLDLRKALRSGAGVDELKELIAAGWRGRDDRGAEVRLALGERRAFVPITRYG